MLRLLGFKSFLGSGSKYCTYKTWEHDDDFFQPKPASNKTSIRRTSPLHPMTTATPQITTVSAGLYSEITIRAHIQRVQVRVQDPSDDLDRRNDNRKEEALCKMYRGLSVSEGLWVFGAGFF